MHAPGPCAPCGPMPMQPHPPIRPQHHAVPCPCGRMRPQPCGPVRPYTRGPLPNFLGCSLGPSPFASASAIKWHQKSTWNSAGSSVKSLAPPRATPRLGGAVVSCQYFPCSFALALRAPGLWLGVKAPPSRSALAAVGSSPAGPLKHCPFHRLFILETAVFHFEPRGSKTRSRLLQHCLAAPAQGR
jgi:hypothetical protein